MLIRNVSAEDREQVGRINNYYIAETSANFILQPLSLKETEEWLSGFKPEGRYRMLVADDGDGRVLGFACSSRFHPRAAYETSVMTSIYLDPECRSAGLGSKLYAALLDLFEGIDVHRAYAGITLPNPASEALHRKFGFTKAAHYTEAGRKFGRYWDVVWYELSLPWKSAD